MDEQLRDFVRARAMQRCEYCQLAEHFFTQLFQIEHVIAKCHGGSDEAENLALACRRCNLHKGPNLSGIDPDTNTLTRLYHPRTDRWLEHFKIDVNGEMCGMTDVGRTTLRVLNMNDPQRIELRRAIGAVETDHNE
jgi:hypothetical protein